MIILSLVNIQNFEKKYIYKNVFFSCPNDPSVQTGQKVPRSKGVLCSSRAHTERDRHETEDALSGFHAFFKFYINLSCSAVGWV